MTESHEAIVLCGGGVYGALLLGAIEQKHFNNIRMIAGTSIGAVIGTLLCLDYQVKDILDTLVRHVPFVRDVDIHLLFTRYGLYDTQRFLSLVRQMISSKTNVRITFAQLYEQFGKDLIITGTNVSQGRSCYFNRMECPDMCVIDAIEISTCVPFVFPCTLFESDMYIDGAFTDNLPVVYTEQYIREHYTEEPFHVTVLNIRYEFTDLKIDSLVHFVIHMITLFVNHHTPLLESTPTRNVYTLIARDLVHLTVSEPSELLRLFESGKEQMTTQLKESNAQNP